MTTSIRVARAQDLFAENEVMNLNQARTPLTNAVAGASWVAGESSPHGTLLLVLKFVIALVKSRLPHNELWLLVGTRAWQPGTSLVRYHKLWGALRARGVKVPSGSQSTEEVMVESEGRLKFFGAAKLADFAAEDVAQFLLTEHCTYLVALPSDLPLHTLLNLGWSGDVAIDSEIISRVAESDALLLKEIGEFDDPERGVVAIGRPPVVNALFA